MNIIMSKKTCVIEDIKYKKNKPKKPNTDIFK